MPAPPHTRTAEQAAMFENRVAKTHRHRARWAERVGTDAYRVYDRDIPEVPLTIDRYAAHLVVADVRRDDERAGEDDGPDPWLSEMVVRLARITTAPASAIHVKRRARQRGPAQYEVAPSPACDVVVQEDGLRFAVELDRHLDTGLFLDHRALRARFGRDSAGKKTLNLYAYTGAFSVHAAARGATATTSVDISSTYLDWFGRNLALNGLEAARHERVRADAFDALREFVAARRVFDRIIVDPPTFSNSKRMEGTFDVQRDHEALLLLCARALAPGGVVYFSNNRHRFTLSPALEDAFRVDDITDATIDLDFRQRRPHRAWRLSAPLGAAFSEL